MDFNARVVVMARTSRKQAGAFLLLRRLPGSRAPPFGEEQGLRGFDSLRGSAVAGWRVGRRDMPGEEGGNLLKKGLSPPTPLPPRDPQDFRLVGRRRAGVRSGLVLKKIPLRRTKRDILVTSITPSSVCFACRRKTRRGSRGGSPLPARALRSAEASAPAGVQGRSPWGLLLLLELCHDALHGLPGRRPQSARLLSLFDSLGPIMSGPSSSHTAGMARIGRMGRSLVGGTPERITLHFFGALSHTYKGHASDSAVVAGLIGERRTPQCPARAAAGCGAGRRGGNPTHPDSGRNPNTVSMELLRGGRTYAVAGVSVGGGEIEMTELEGFPRLPARERGWRAVHRRTGWDGLCSRRGLGRCPAFPA